MEGHGDWPGPKVRWGRVAERRKEGLELGSGQCPGNLHPLSSALAQQAGGHARRIRGSWSWVGSRSRSGLGAVVQRSLLLGEAFCTLAEFSHPSLL